MTDAVQFPTSGNTMLVSYIILAKRSWSMDKLTYVTKVHPGRFKPDRLVTQFSEITKLLDTFDTEKRCRMEHSDEGIEV
jgi:hypothetical protein